MTNYKNAAKSIEKRIAAFEAELTTVSGFNERDLIDELIVVCRRHLSDIEIKTNLEAATAIVRNCIGFLADNIETKEELKNGKQ